MKNNHSGFSAHLLTACALVCSSTLSLPVQASAGKSFDVKTYGAKGDGVTDDTNAILATIAAAQAVGNGTVIFSNGTYLYSQVLPVNGPLTLVGPQVGQRGQKAVLLAATPNATVNFKGSGGSIQGIYFDGKGRIRRGVYIEGGSNVVIGSCTFNPAFDVAIDVNAGSGNRVYNNLISTSSGTGILIKETGCTVESNQVFESTGPKSRGIHIINCINANVTKNDFTDLKLGSDSVGILDQGSTSSQIVGNEVFGYDQCVRLTGDASPLVSLNQLQVKNGSIGVKAELPNSATINQNVIESPARSGIHVMRSSGTVTITANTINNCGTYGILHDDKGGNVTVDKNQLNQCGLSAEASVIFISTMHATAININKNTYTGNANKLRWFITSRPFGDAVAAGNKTTTLLPTDI